MNPVQTIHGLVEEPPESDPIGARVGLLDRLARANGHIVSLDGHVDEACAAALVGRSPLTLRNWRAADRPIPFRQLGGKRGRVTYSLRALAEFLSNWEQP